MFGAGLSGLARDLSVRPDAPNRKSSDQPAVMSGVGFVLRRIRRRASPNRFQAAAKTARLG
jgi:hypothetical protein